MMAILSDENKRQGGLEGELPRFACQMPETTDYAFIGV
jgi:hypothetical protein